MAEGTRREAARARQSHQLAQDPGAFRLAPGHVGGVEVGGSPPSPQVGRPGIWCFARSLEDLAAF